MAIIDNLKKIYGGITGQYDPQNVYRSPSQKYVPAAGFEQARREQMQKEMAALLAPPPLASFQDMGGGYGYGGGGYSPVPATRVELPPAEQVVDQLAERAADLVEEIFNDLREITSLTNITFDEDKLKEEALGLITPFFDEEKDNIIKDIQEGRLQFQEDLDYRLAQIEQTAKEQARSLDIRQAKTDEELRNTLEDIGATTQEDIGTLRNKLRDALTTTERNLLQSGLGYSGVGREQMQNLRGDYASQENILARRGGAQETQAQTSAKYNLQMIEEARTAAKENREMELGRQETLAERNKRLYGEGENYGLMGERELQKLGRRKETTLQSEIENLKNQRRSEAQYAALPKQQEIQTKLNTLSAIRGGSYI